MKSTEPYDLRLARIHLQPLLAKPFGKNIVKFSRIVPWGFDVMDNALSVIELVAQRCKTQVSMSIKNRVISFSKGQILFGEFALFAIL